ncbi:MAG: hypothetical protein ACRD07_15120 [Acidimicrobiales bacterium]
MVGSVAKRHSHALVVRGEPGIRTSALLASAADYARLAHRAIDDVESETAFAYAALETLLRPHLPSIHATVLSCRPTAAASL